MICNSNGYDAFVAHEAMLPCGGCAGVKLVRVILGNAGARMRLTDIDLNVSVRRNCVNM